MDISIFSNFAIVAIFLPLIFGLYLLFSRLNLSFVNKKILNYGCTIVNLISLLIFSVLYFVFPEKNILNKSLEIFSIEKFSVDFGFLIDENNILFLIFSSILCIFISIYSKKYFDIKKQFIFTKQRFFAFLSMLCSSLYLVLSSINLFQSIVILFLQSTLILIFSYIDIFKNSTNQGAIRFHRISQIGNFALVVVALILFRYAIYSQGYIETTTLDYIELGTLINYTYGISAIFEFVLLCLCFIVFVSSRLCLFPFSCYYSFFANSSNVLYLSILVLANNIIGIFLFLKFITLFGIFKDTIVYFEIFVLFGILFAVGQMFFEQNIKIIFGYLFSLLNSVFIILFLHFNQKFVLYSYFACCSAIAIILSILFIKDKNNFARRLINKRFGFALEKSHIILFENMSSKITEITELLNEKIFQNIIPFAEKVFSFVVVLFTVKIVRTSGFKFIRNILIIFTMIVIFAIFMALFGGLN